MFVLLGAYVVAIVLAMIAFVVGYARIWLTDRRVARAEREREQRAATLLGQR